MDEVTHHARIIVEVKHQRIDVLLAEYGDAALPHAPGRFRVYFPEWRFLKDHLQLSGLPETLAKVGDHKIEATQQQLREFGFF